MVGRGGKQSLDVFLLGKDSCRVGDLQVTALGPCLSPSEGCEILTWCCFPFAAPQISLCYPSCFVLHGLLPFGANGIITICDWGRGLGCDLSPCTLMTLSKSWLVCYWTSLLRSVLLCFRNIFRNVFQLFLGIFFPSREGEVSSKLAEGEFLWEMRLIVHGSVSSGNQDRVIHGDNDMVNNASAHPHTAGCGQEANSCLMLAVIC